MKAQQQFLEMAEQTNKSIKDTFASIRPLISENILGGVDLINNSRIVDMEALGLGKIIISQITSIYNN